MVTLDNGVIRLALDDSARIAHLENLTSGKGNIIEQPVCVFRATLHSGGDWENAVRGEAQAVQVTGDGARAAIYVSSLHGNRSDAAISLKLNIWLEGEQVRFGAEIENHSEDVLTDFYYPCLGTIRTLGNGAPDLLYPMCLGERYVNVGKYLSACESWDEPRVIASTYPGGLSMQWMLLEDGDQCLYLSGRDDTFYSGAQRAVGSEREDIVLEMDKMGYVRPGETWVCPEYLLWLYRGAWTRAVDEYAAWAKTWRKPIKPRDWMRDMNGYFLVINKQQYGDEVWDYHAIPELYARAKEHGCDVLGLFGWYHTGHDNGYPDLEVSPTMGGEQALKAGIAAVHAAGGHVTLYYQGHLMDIGSKFYREKGYRLEQKSIWGTPYYEYYAKWGSSEFLHAFSNKVFSTVCPSCKEWQDLMAERADWIASLDADGALYDQIGGMAPRPCFDATHEHKEDKPTLAYAPGRLALFARIRAQVETHANFAFMTECVTDVYSQFLDALHGIGSTPRPAGSRMSLAGGGEKPAVCLDAHELFRYAFPETVVTIRNPKPYMTPRIVNYAIAHGFRFEMELRYERDKAYVTDETHPEWKQYARDAGALRVEFGDYLLRGRFLASAGVHNENPVLVCGHFAAADGRELLAVWNDTPKAQELCVSVESHAISGWVKVGARGVGCPATIAPDSLVLLMLD